MLFPIQFGNNIDEQLHKNINLKEHYFFKLKNNPAKTILVKKVYNGKTINITNFQNSFLYIRNVCDPVV